MAHHGLSVTVLVMAVALGAGQAKAEPGSRLGGGFLELLITGRDPTPRPWLNTPV